VTDIETPVLEWLRSGSEDAADTVGLPWEVKAVDKSMYVAEHLKMPFTLVIMFSDEFNDALTALAVGLLSRVSALGIGRSSLTGSLTA